MTRRIIFELALTIINIDGRRPIYLFGTPLLVIGSLGAAAAQSIVELIFWRFIQALGASPGLAVGSGVIGDIYKLEERGRALGIFFSVRVSTPLFRNAR